MEIKSKLLELLSWAEAEEHRWRDQLTPAQRNANGEALRWSAKDNLAHLAEWQKRAVEDVEAILRGETPREETDDVDAANAAIFEANRQAAFSDLQHKFDLYNQKMDELVKTLPEEDLTDVNRYADSAGLPLWNRAIGSRVIHTISHLTAFYIENGKPEEAIRLQETVGDKLLEIDNSPHWRGTTLYNLACFHAQAGQKEQALTKLREALDLRSDLRDWSRQDPDLLPLHGDPLYESLY